MKIGEARSQHMPDADLSGLYEPDEDEDEWYGELGPDDPDNQDEP